MEWLRSVDLAEYAPNLRGSGVHGGLMVRQFNVQSSRETQIISLKGSNLKSLMSSGSGTTVQCGDHGFTAEHSP